MIHKESETYKLIVKFLIVALAISFIAAVSSCGPPARTELLVDIVERVDTVQKVIYLNNGVELSGSDYTRLQNAKPGDEAFY